MKFLQCKVKAIRADTLAPHASAGVANGEITFAFGISLNDENLEVASELAKYADKDAGHVTVEVSPQQLPLIS
ncbi:MAG: hypothetical protein ABSG01_16095 [Anaerolineales bacterium]|jgi:hypothetical protein